MLPLLHPVLTPVLLMFQRHISIECPRYDKYRSAPADAAARRRGPPSTKAQARRGPPTKPNALFIAPPQRRAREVVRPRHDRSPFARADAPPAGQRSGAGAAAQDAGADVAMDMSADAPADNAAPARYPTPAEPSTRDATPALSFASSDTETEGALPDEGGDWQCRSAPEEPQMLFYASSQDTLPDALKTPPLVPSSLMPDHMLGAAPALPWELQYPEEHSNPIRRFLDGLRRPVGHRFAAFYAVGIRSQDDIQALAGMPQDWDTVKTELMKHDVTLMEWLCIKAGLEKIREKWGLGIPKVDCGD